MEVKQNKTSNNAAKQRNNQECVYTVETGLPDLQGDSRKRLINPKVG